MSEFIVNFGETAVPVTLVWVGMVVTFLGSYVNLFLPKKWYYTLIAAVSFTGFSALSGFYAWEIANNVETIREVFAGEIFYYIIAIVPLSALIMIAFSLLAFWLRQRVFAQIIGAICAAVIVMLNVWA